MGGSSDLGSSPKEERGPLLASCDWLTGVQAREMQLQLEPRASGDAAVLVGGCPAGGQGGERHTWPGLARRLQEALKWKSVPQEGLD